MKKLLITGHRGLLGSACVRRFKDEFEILTTNGDLRDYSYVSYWFSEYEPDYVINCAAKVGGVKSNRDEPVPFITDNLAIQMAVFHAAHKSGVKKLVNIGTSCLFPKDAPLPVKEESLMSGPFNPDVAAYASAKLSGYFLCQAYWKQYGRKFITVAPSNIYGVNDNYGVSAHVVPALMNRMEEAKESGGPLKAWGDGTAIREFIYADDAADALAAVLEKYDSPEILNIGTGVGITIRELTKELAAVMGYDGSVMWDHSQPTGVQEKTFDVSKLKALGWTPKTSLREGLEKMYADYTNNPNIRSK
jgi:GDP-L-fucose synthase